MDILIGAVGSAGDVYPFIAVGQELQRRGHAVRLIAAAAYRGKVERAGLEFICGMEQAALDEFINDPDIWHPYKAFPAFWKRLGPKLPEAYSLLLTALRSPDTVLVASSLALPLRLMQETHGLKLATVHLAPCCYFSASDPAVRAGLGFMRFLPAWARRTLLNLIEDKIIDPLMRADLDPLRASLGLAPVRKVMSTWIHSPQRVICAFPDWFAAPQADWPANTVCTAFPRLPAGPGEALGEALLRFLDAGPAPLAFAPGSVMAHGRLFFQRAIEASAALGMRAVLVTPYRDQLPEVLPPSVHYEPYAPFDRLAPRVAAFVHHGGIGTSAAVLAAGKPQLITPFAFDQPDNAARLIKLGVAASVAPRAPAGKWAHALSGLLNRPETLAACRAVAARMAAEAPAAQQIADLIEDLGNSAKVGPPSTIANEGVPHAA